VIDRALEEHHRFGERAHRSRVRAGRPPLDGRTIVVARKDGTEDIPVAKVTSIKGDTVNLNDGTKSRSVKAEAIIATK